MVKDEIVGWRLYPCMGFGNRRRHVYAIDEKYQSGNQNKDVYFMTLREANEKFGAENITVISSIYRFCPNCKASIKGVSTREAMDGFLNLKETGSQSEMAKDKL